MEKEKHFSFDAEKIAEWVAIGTLVAGAVGGTLIAGASDNIFIQPSLKASLGIGGGFVVGLLSGLVAGKLTRGLAFKGVKKLNEFLEEKQNINDNKSI